MTTITHSTGTNMQPAVPKRAASRGGFGEFFKYHGWLSPGVRLFRRIGFKAKAAWISLAFLVPLVMALGMLAKAALEQVDIARLRSEPASSCRARC
jgi:hypothetical protein